MNLIVLNIVVSDLFISSIGIFVDVMGMVGMVGTSMRGRDIEHGLCQFEGFIYMTTGMFNDNFPYLPIYITTTKVISIIIK